MKDKHDIAKSVPDKAGVGPVTVADDDVELTPKEEATAANHLPLDEHLAKIEKKLEHDAEAANRLPQTEQLAKFEKNWSTMIAATNRAEGGDSMTANIRGNARDRNLRSLERSQVGDKHPKGWTPNCGIRSVSTPGCPALIQW